MAASDLCFMCDDDVQNCAHVISEADKSISILKGRGLINFRLTPVMNGVGLCASCHVKYDDHCDPKLIFYPSDITFFIRYELRDRIRRQKDGSGRRIPNATQYTNWCGLYTRVIFKHHGLDSPSMGEPAPWEGAPLAALRRAFGVMGCPRAAGIPRPDLVALRELWDLYFSDDDPVIEEIAVKYRVDEVGNAFGLGDCVDDQDAPEVAEKGEEGGGEEAPRGDVTDLEALDEETEWDEEDEEDEDEPPRKKRATTGSFNYANWCWDFGPESTSNDKAEEMPLLGPNSFFRHQ
ncbi:hypothetical protein BJX99DRAFT_219433 [Aspergillus californicus]